jgi:cation transport ATPase
MPDRPARSIPPANRKLQSQILKSQISNSPSDITALLARPDRDRQREYKYRFSQSVVFGLPVIALQYWGRALGPADWQRWVSLLQALLTGWVLYVNLGLLIEGLILLSRGRGTADLLVATVAAVLYLASLVSAVRGIVFSHLWFPLQFHVCVIVLAAWSGWRWMWQARRRPRDRND